MRKSREEAVETRRHIIDVASGAFREHGISGIGLVGLMGAAGLTHGGFYKHFASKDALLVETVGLSARELADHLEEALAGTPGGKGLQAALADYLSVEHRDDVAGGCPFAALGAELARASVDVRNAATEGVLRLLRALAKGLDGQTKAGARNEAMVMLSTLVGALTLSRIVNDEAMSAQFLRQARKALEEQGQH